MPSTLPHPLILNPQSACERGEGNSDSLELEWQSLSHICIGEESFEHANVLSEKINFSALGGPGVAIFGPDDLHPMY